MSTKLAGCGPQGVTCDLIEVVNFWC